MADIPTDKPVVDPAIKEREEMMKESDFEAIVASDFYGVNHYHSNIIPDDIMNMFMAFLRADFMKPTVRTTEMMDQMTGEMKVVKKVTEKKPVDVRAALILFSKMYPEYFDKLSEAKIAKLNKDSGDNAVVELAKIAKQMFTYPGQRK